MTSEDISISRISCSYLVHIKISREHKHTSKGIDGRRCYCHGTRRVGGVYAVLLEREQDGAFYAPSFYIVSRRSLSLHELYNRFRVLRMVALRVVASSRGEYAVSFLSSRTNK